MPLSPEEQFHNFLTKRSHYLAQLENGTLQKMVEPYKRAKVEIKDKLSKLVASDSTAASLDWRIGRLNSQLAEVNGILGTAALDASDELFSTLSQLAALDSDTYAQMFASQFGKIGVDITRIPLRQVDFIINNNLRGVDLGSKLSKMNDDFLDFVKGELTQSVIQGEDMYRATKRLMPDTKGLTSVVEKRMLYRMNMIARSEIQYVSNSVARATYNENQDVIKGLQFSATLDNRTCTQCSSMDSREFLYKDGINSAPLLPLHPFCFIDHQIPIYTSKGIKHIGKIKKGDLVLTHKGQFKKVTDIIRHKKKSVDIVTITIQYPKISANKKHKPTTKKLTVTDEHPLFINGEWIAAKNISKGDTVKYLATECKRCGQIIPFDKKYCSDSCCSKDITDRQWSDPKHRENISRKNSIANKRQYASGERDPYATTLKAREASMKIFDAGMHPFQTNPMFGEVNPSKRPEVAKKISESKMGDKNPMRKYPELKKQHSKFMKKLYRDHPEKHPNRILAQKGHETWIEKLFREELEKREIIFEKQYPILNFFVDFALVDKKIVIEVDGAFWHKDKKKDLRRQRKIEKEGWAVLRYTGKRVNKEVGKCVDEVCRVLNNHNNNYKFIDLKVVKIEKRLCEQRVGRSNLTEKDVVTIRKLYASGKYDQTELAKKYKVTSPSINSIVNYKSWKDGTNRKNITLYNFSVEDDESYIANGIVSHNCRCTLIPLTFSWKELGAKIPPDKKGASKAFLGQPLKGQLTYNNWLLQQSVADQLEILGPARYDLWKSSKIQLKQMATQKGILRNVYTDKPGALSLQSLTEKQLKGLGVEVAGVKPSSQLSAEVRAQMSARQLRAIDNYVPSDKKSRGIAELTERKLAKDLGAEHVIGKRPFDMFLNNEFIEVKTLIQGRGQIRIRPASMKKKTDFVDKYKVRPHTILVDKRPGSDTYGKIFYRKGLGDFRPTTMTEVKDMKHLEELLKKGSRKTDYNPYAASKVTASRNIKQAENWAKNNLGIKEVDYDDLDKKAGDIVNKYIGGAIDRLEIKPNKVIWNDDLFKGANKRVAALAQEDGSLILNRKYFMNEGLIGNTAESNFAIGQFGTASRGHILRHEMGHMQYFTKGGTETLANKKLTSSMVRSLKDIGEENLQLYVSKYARKSQGEFYAEMMAKVLNGEQLHPVTKKIMRDIEKGIKKGVVSKATKTKGLGAKVSTPKAPPVSSKVMDNIVKSLGSKVDDFDFMDAVNFDDIENNLLIPNLRKTADNWKKIIKKVVDDGLGTEKDVIAFFKTIEDRLDKAGINWRLPGQTYPWSSKATKVVSKKLDVKIVITDLKKTGVTKIFKDSNLTDDTFELAINNMLVQTKRLQSSFPNMKKIAGQTNLELSVHPTIPGKVGKGRGPIAKYDFKKHKISISTKRLTDDIDPGILFGDYSIGNDFMIDYAHEYGHHIHEIIEHNYREFYTKWNVVHRDLGGDKFFKHNISEYAGGSFHEAFAESFAAYTSPRYKTGMLPKTVENYFTKLLGKRKK